MINFCQRDKLNNLSIYSKYFLLANRLIGEPNIDREVIKHLFIGFQEYLACYHNEYCNKQIIPHLCLNLGFIILRYEGEPQWDWINGLVALIEKVNTVNYKNWLVLLLLHYFYKYPLPLNQAFP